MRKIAVVGHVCVDIAPAGLGSTTIAPGRLVETGPLRLTLGGAVANTTRVLGALGAQVQIDAAVGRDPLGRLVASELRSQGAVLGEPTIVDGAATSYSLVLETPGVDRAFWHHVGANARFDGSGVNLDDIDLLHLGYPSLLPALLEDDAAALVTLFSRARRAGTTTSLDLAVIDPDSAAGQLDWQRILDAVLPLTDILSPSLADLTSALRIAGEPSPALTHGLAAELVERGAAVVTLSNGAHGMYLSVASSERLSSGGRALVPLADRWANTSIHIPAEPVDHVATTNGAGDASTGGLLFAISRETDPAVAGALAAASAAAVIGASESIADTIRDRHPALAWLLPTRATDTSPRHPIVRPVPR